MKLTVIKALSAAALLLCPGLAFGQPEAAPPSQPEAAASGQAASQAPAAPAPEAKPAQAPAPPKKTARADAGPTKIEETPVRLEGRVIGVPIPNVTVDTYINLGSTQGVKPGEYFLAYSPTVRTIAVLKVISVQDRMATVQLQAQLASMREGDRVKRITEDSAKTLSKQISALSGFAPPLASEVVMSPEMAKVAEKVAEKEVKKAAAPVETKEEFAFTAKVGDKGVDVSWTAVAGAAGYVLFRSQDQAALGEALTPAPTKGLLFQDRPPKAGTYFYRLAIQSVDGSRSPSAYSVEVSYVPAKGGMMGIGGAPAKVEAKAAAPFLIPETPPPQAKETILLAKAGGKGIDLSWTAVEGAKGYMVFRSDGPDQLGKPIMKSPVKGLKHSDGPLKSGTYVYRLVALAADGSHGKLAPSISVEYEAPAGGIMGIGGSPAKLTAATLDPFDISTATVVMEAAAPKEEKKPKPKPPPAPKPAPAPAPAPAPVEAEAEEETAEASEEAETLPPTPERLDIKLEGTTVVIKWNPVSSKTPLAGYVIYRAYLRGAGYSLTDVPIKSTTYRDRSAKPGVTYEYWVASQTVEGKTSEPTSRRAVEIPTSGPIPFF